MRKTFLSGEMAFDIGDIEDENFKNVSADVRAIFEPFINCDCDSHGKSKSHTPHFSGQANGLKRGHDEDSEAWDASFSETNPEDPVDAEDFFDLESALAQARAQILAQKQAKNKSSYKKPTRVRYLQFSRKKILHISEWYLTQDLNLKFDQSISSEGMDFSIYWRVSDGGD